MFPTLLSSSLQYTGAELFLKIPAPSVHYFKATIATKDMSWCCLPRSKNQENSQATTATEHTSWCCLQRSKQQQNPHPQAMTASQDMSWCCIPRSKKQQNTYAHSVGGKNYICIAKKNFTSLCRAIYIVLDINYDSFKRHPTVNICSRHLSQKIL
jgi:hypothetical protein